jgi:suppressor of ftsI
MPGPVSRRDLLKGVTAAAVSTAAVTPTQAKQAKPGGEFFELRCGFKETILDGNRVRLRAYNGQVPGPLITTRPGDTMRIRLKNELPPYDSRAWNGDHNVPHKLDSTNLHVHGMDVIPHLFQPLGTSDPLAPMIGLGPGEQLDYSFEIPDDHPPGLYWYHPHHHGSTAVQVVTGMAGPIIVRGKIDEVPEIKAARDIPLVIQDVGLFPSETDPTLWTYEPKQNAIWQTFGGNVTIYNPKTGQAESTKLKGGFTTGDYALRYYLLNGEPFFKEVHDNANPTAPTPSQLKPQRIKVRPGEVVRFRVLNGCSDNLMPILVEGHDLHLIALDGINFDAVRTIQPYGADGTGQVMLSPANRAEFLIKGSTKPGIYRILQLAQSQQFLASPQKVIAEIEVVGTPTNMALPTKLPPATRYYPLIKPSEIKTIRTIEFGGAFPGVVNPYVGIDFLINNMQYGEQAVPNVVRLGDCEEWQLVVEGAHHGGTEGHPFHIHEISFELISINGVAQPPGTFMDTIWIAKDSVVVVRMRFLGWPGKTVFHCHILPHEDTGMMQNFLILPADKPGHH